MQPIHKKKTFLCFTISIGLAHLVRILAVAEELQRRGHTVLVTLPKSKHSHFSNSSVKFIDLPDYTTESSMTAIQKFLFQGNFQQHIFNEIELYDTYHPDAVLIDFRYTAAISALAKNIPVFSISNSTALPVVFSLPKFTNFKIISHITSYIIEFVIVFLKKILIAKISRQLPKQFTRIQFSDIVQKITYLIPEHRNYMKINSKNLKLHYVSLLNWRGFQDMKIPEGFKKKTKNKKIYLTFGGTGFDKNKFTNLSYQLADKGYDVVVSSSNIAHIKDFKKHHNLFVEKYLPSNKILEIVDLIICHGGYNTMYEAASHHVPIISVPFNIDQLIHSYRFQELGLAKCLSTFNIHFIYLLAKLDLEKFQDIGRKVKIVDIINSVEDIFSNKAEYTKNVHHSQHMFPSQNGAKKTADIIEHLT